MQAALGELPAFYMQSDFEECLADTYLAAGRLDEAATEYRRVLSLYPNNALAHYGFGAALASKGDAAGSRSEMRKFLEVWKDADKDLPQYQDAVRRLQ